MEQSWQGKVGMEFVSFGNYDNIFLAKPSANGSNCTMWGLLSLLRHWLLLKERVLYRLTDRTNEVHDSTVPLTPNVSSQFSVQESWKGLPERVHIAQYSCIPSSFIWAPSEAQPETRIQEQVVYLKSEGSPRSWMGKWANSESIIKWAATVGTWILIPVEN